MENIDKISSVIALNFSDIGFIVNGDSDDDIKHKPFEYIFTQERIRKSWSNLGFLPMTRKQLLNKKIRHEMGEEGNVGDKLQDLQDLYVCKSQESDKEVFNNVFSLKIPNQTPVSRSKHEEEQINTILQNKAAFRPSGLFLNTKNMLVSS